MTLESYSFSKSVDYKKLEMPFGNYYLFDKFYIGELKEGVHLDWKKTEIVSKIVEEYYGKDAKVGFISNRVNHFSVDPNNWTKSESEYDLIVASAIVMYNNLGYMNASLEKQFTRRSIKRCMSLQEAINWIYSLKEFN